MEHGPDGATRTRPRRASVFLTATAAALAASALLVGCGGGENSASSGGGGGGGGGAEESMSAKIAFSTSTIPDLVSRTYGWLELGKQFGLQETKDDFTSFEDSAVATQSMLSGKIDAIESSFLSLYVIRERGQDIKAFCPTLLTSSYVLVGDEKVGSLTDLQKPDVKVGIDSPGGTVDAVVAAMFKAETGKVVTGRDLPNTETITSSTERATALGAGKIDAAIVHTYQLSALEQQAPNLKSVASYPEEVDESLDHALQASGEWLDSHQKTAAALCASYLFAAQKMAADYKLFEKVVMDKRYDDAPPPTKADAKDLWDEINSTNFWPLDGKGFEPERLKFMAELGKGMGLLKEDVDVEAAIDRPVYEAALKLVKEQGGGS